MSTIFFSVRFYVTKYVCAQLMYYFILFTLQKLQILLFLKSSQQQGPALFRARDDQDVPTILAVDFQTNISIF